MDFKTGSTEDGNEPGKLGRSDHRGQMEQTDGILQAKAGPQGWSPVKV